MVDLNLVDSQNVDQTVKKRLGVTRTARRQAEELRRQAEESEEQRLEQEAAQKEAEAARLALDNNVLIPSATDFAALNARFVAWAVQLEDVLRAARAVGALQSVLLENLMEVAESMGKRFFEYAPNFYSPDQRNALAREFFDVEFSLLDLVAGLPDAFAGALGISSARGDIYNAARALLLKNMRGGKNPPAIFPSNVPLLPTQPAPQPAPATIPARVILARTSLPIETWVAERATIGLGSTSLETCYSDYQECCSALDIAPITPDMFANELRDNLFVDGTKTKKGYYFFLKLK